MLITCAIEATYAWRQVAMPGELPSGLSDVHAPEKDTRERRELQSVMSAPMRHCAQALPESRCCAAPVGQTILIVNAPRRSSTSKRSS